MTYLYLRVIQSAALNFTTFEDSACFFLSIYLLTDQSELVYNHPYLVEVLPS